MVPQGGAGWVVDGAVAAVGVVPGLVVPDQGGQPASDGGPVGDDIDVGGSPVGAEPVRCLAQGAPCPGGQVVGRQALWRRTMGTGSTGTATVTPMPAARAWTRGSSAGKWAQVKGTQARLLQQRGFEVRAKVVGGGFVVGQHRAAVHPIGAEQGGDQPPVGVGFIGERDHPTQLPARVAERDCPRLQVSRAVTVAVSHAVRMVIGTCQRLGVPRQFVAEHRTSDGPRSTSGRTVGVRRPRRAGSVMRHRRNWRLQRWGRGQNERVPPVDPRLELGGGQGLGEQEALDRVAAEPASQSAVRLVLDALGDHAHAQAWARSMVEATSAAARASSAMGRTKDRSSLSSSIGSSRR